MVADVDRVDWGALEQFLVDEIENCARCARCEYGVPLARMAVHDFYLRDLLILWPGLSADVESEGDTSGGPEMWRYQHPVSRIGDDWAARLTIEAGVGGRRWNAVVDRFRDVVVGACRTATTRVVDGGWVRSGFHVAAVDGTDELLARSVTEDILAAHYPEVRDRVELTRHLGALTPDARVQALFEMLTGPSPVLNRSEVAGLLANCGTVAAVRAAVQLRRFVADGEENADLWCDVIDAVGVGDGEVIGALTACVRDCSVAQATRIRAAASLSWLGHLDPVLDALAIFPDAAISEVILTPFLGTAKNGTLTLDYRVLDKACATYPWVHDDLVRQLSPTRMYSIDASDIAVAMEALSSPWLGIRQHAATVLLTVHV
ncbi:hypothetical protein [Gordonia sp. OPL2]|uniref:hypothetical protein n=1 Tax=Gordonia sp. OPL2 TaxID=2486274 RepID=UPI001654CEEA|nr:hypothetical protein [Gordonia sp. OPL2]ROZ85985.1 hypothetical protein EEB19_24435 [Gordonia sp. OPL2]